MLRSVLIVEYVSVKGRLGAYYKEDGIADLVSRLCILIGVRTRYEFDGRDIESFRDSVSVSSYDYTNKLKTRLQKVNYHGLRIG